MAGTSGYSMKAVDKTSKAIESELKILEQYLSSAQKDISSMNNNIWYGGESANKWYTRMTDVFKKDVKYYNQVVKIQNTFAKAANASKQKVSKGSSGIAGGVDTSPDKPIPASSGSPEVQPGGDWQGGFEYYME